MSARTRTIIVFSLVASMVVALFVGLSLAQSGSGLPSFGIGASNGSGEIDDIKVKGDFGSKPTLTIPGGKAPTKLEVKVLKEGDGAKVLSGDLLVSNYLGQTWEPKDGKPNIFDNSFDRGAPAAFSIGVGQVIKGWDQALVDQKIGSRVLLVAPPELAYGPTNPQQPLGGQALVFVVDVVDAVKKDVFANGTPATPTTKGLPKVESPSGKAPKIVSTAGVTVGEKPISGFVLTGTGDVLDEKKSVLIQFLQSTVANKASQSSWDTNGPQVVPVAELLKQLPELKGAKVGSRLVVVSKNPQDAKDPGIVVLDIVKQF